MPRKKKDGKATAQTAEQVALREAQRSYVASQNIALDPYEQVVTGEPPQGQRRAEDWQAEEKRLPWKRERCRECNNPMWVRNYYRNDICEECGFLMRDRMQEQAHTQMRRRSGMLINPFTQ